MKKHKKAARAALAVALAAATAAGCFFTACGGESLTSYFAGANEYGRYDDVVYYNDAQKLDVLDGCDVSAMYDDGMAVVSKTVGADTVYGLYDFSGETFVIPMGSSIIISIGNGLYGQTEDYLQGSYQVYSKYGRAAEVSDIYCHIFLWTILLYCYYAEIFGISD